jgi:antitoxin ParD1/3/4
MLRVAFARSKRQSLKYLLGTIMNLTLQSDLEQFVSDQIERGLYNSPTEVIHAGLKLLKERYRQLTDLREKLQQGADQLTRGEGIPAEEVFAELHDRNKSLQDALGRRSA